jgi:branched-subunit amino acid transport protein
MQRNVYLYILGMWGISYLIRVLPLTLIRREITNRTIRSFLYYVPYVTLAVMTFPAMTQATQSPVSGTLALLAGLVLAWWGASLFKVAAACCAVVFLTEMVIC